MEKVVRLILLMAVCSGSLIISSCTDPGRVHVDAAEKYQSDNLLTQIEILPYKLNDSLTVTQVKATMVAREKDSAFTLIIQASQSNSIFLDSLYYALKKDDTARASIVFTRLPYDEKNPPVINLIYH